MQKKQAVTLIAGVDEAGRGPLAGPVYAAAVILNEQNPIDGLTDSKKLTEKQREALFALICERALSYGIGIGTVEEIERINILQATFLAMQRAVAALTLQPALVLIDGNQLPRLECAAKTIIKGDESEPAISAASILAKVSRDREMTQMDQIYPHYGFAKHKGYATEQHLQALKNHGPCLIHRKTFSPIAQKELPITEDVLV